jgi:hypothetical protein
MHVRHSKVVTAPDSNDGKVSSNAWNDDHIVTGTPNMLLGLDASGNLAEVDPGTISGGGVSSSIVPVADRTALAALSTLTPAYLKESGREGIFVWSSASLSAQVTADPRQGVYVAPASETSGAAGAWVRRYSGDLNVKWFGAKGDRSVDDYAAFAAAVALLGNPGGAIFVPDGYYRMSAKLTLTAGVRIYGSHTARNPGIIGGTSYPFPTFYYGAVLYFDAGIPGIELQPNSPNTDPAVGATDWAQAGATSSELENLVILSAGGGTIDTYGIKNRAQVRLTNLVVRNFSGHGIHTTAIGGGSPYYGEEFGNADLSIYRNVLCGANGGHGFYTIGGDTNVILFDCCNATGNAGWGFYDNSLLGNTYVNCHTSSNTAGSYKNTSAVGLSTYTGCYIEGYSLTSLSVACAWINGQGSEVGQHPVDTPAYVIEGAMSHGAAPYHLNQRGTTDVTFKMGVDDTGLTAYAWGDSADTPSGSAYHMTLGKTGSNVWGNNWWNLVYAGSQQIIQYPRAAVSPRAYAPSFPNGIFLGAQATGPRIFYGTAAPASGTWALGDIVWNSAPSTGATMYWRCTVAGSPGTWEAVSLLSASPTVGVGYTTGAGGTVTQATSRTTGVTLNKVCGNITLVSAAGSSSWQSFTVTNSAVAANDTIRVVQKSGTDKYMIHITAVGAGSFEITFATTGGTTTEQPVFNFAVTKGVAA